MIYRSSLIPLKKLLLCFPFAIAVFLVSQVIAEEAFAEAKFGKGIICNYLIPTEELEIYFYDGTRVQPEKFSIWHAASVGTFSGEYIKTEKDAEVLFGELQSAYGKPVFAESKDGTESYPFFVVNQNQWKCRSSEGY